MTTREGSRLVGRARGAGAVLKVEPDGGVLLDMPDGFPESLLVELRRYRDDVAAALEDEAEFEAALRSWLPGLGSAVKDRATGRAGALWGATRHGLIVDFGSGSPLLTMDPREVVRP